MAHKILRAKSHTYTSDLSRPAPTIAPSALWCGRTLLVLLATLSAVLLSGGDALAQGSVAGDKAALTALYNATDGSNWTNNTNWLSNEPLSKWYGVTINDDGRNWMPPTASSPPCRWKRGWIGNRQVDRLAGCPRTELGGKHEKSNQLIG